MTLKLPKHISLTIEHNDHKNYYEGVEDWLSCSGAIFDWKDDESKQRAIDTDEVWTMQWYPNTPIGFMAIAAPTLEELLEYANENV